MNWGLYVMTIVETKMQYTETREGEFKSIMV